MIKSAWRLPIQTYTVALLLFVFVFSSCSLDRKTARSIDGQWRMISCAWEGRPPYVLPGKTDTIRSDWKFKACRSVRYYGIYKCEGSVFNSSGSKKDAAFLWDINYEGKVLNFIPVDTQAQINMTFNGGDWQIETLNRKRLVIASDNCSYCIPQGKTRLEFERISR